MFSWTAVQGEGTLLPLKVTGCPLNGSLPLSATVSTGTTDAPLLVVTAAWAPAGPPYVECTLIAEQTASLAPGAYVVQVGLADGSGSLAFGVLNVVAAPGNTPSYDVLATPSLVLSQYPTIAADPAKVAALPNLLQKATEVVRRYCNRTFSRRTYTEYLSPSLEGEVLLREIPVNRVTRLSRKPRTAIAINADPSVYQVAYVDYLTADALLPAPSNVTYTGLVLTGWSSGASSSTPILFSGLTTVNDLAAAVNAVSGWTAVVDPSGYGAWPIGELYCDGTSQGALSDGVQLNVFSEDVSTSRIDLKTGMLQLAYGSVGAGGDARWGPGWSAWTDASAYLSVSDDLVRATYDAGFTTVPYVVQQAAAEIVKAAFSRMDVDYALKSETIGEYSYELRDDMDLSIPVPVRRDLASFVIHRA